MDQGGLAVVRQDQGCRWVFSALLLGTCLFPGHGTAQSLSAANPKATALLTGAVTPAIAEAHFLQTMSALLRQSRAAEAYQLGRIALKAHAGSARIRLALAYAAEASGKCQIAIHRHHLSGRNMALPYRRLMDVMRTKCDGLWQREVTLSVTTGYRKSLVDRARHVSLRPAPGSVIHGLCKRLRGLCNPDAVFRITGARASGIDIWTQLSIGHLYSDGGKWDVAITPALFVRSPRRSGYRGGGGSLRLEALRYLDGGRKLQVFTETGASYFQQGDTQPAIAQKHRKVGMELVVPHGELLASRIGHHRLWVTSRWLDLRHRVSDVHLVADGGGTLSGWIGIAMERGSQSGPGLLPGSRAQTRQAGIRLRLTQMEIDLHHLLRRETFSGVLPFLAAPHRATTQSTGVALTPRLAVASNLKVVLSLTHRRILSPDPYRPRVTKNLFLTIKYRLQSGPMASSKI